MRSYWRGSALALITAGFCLALGAPAQAGCVALSGTADGFDKETAVSRAQLALADYVKQYKAEKRLRAVSVSDMRASPQPYWRSSVSAQPATGMDFLAWWMRTMRAHPQARA